MMDEQFLVSLGDKVHRGQEGRALKGMQPGGKCFRLSQYSHRRPAPGAVHPRRFCSNAPASIISRVRHPSGGGVGAAQTSSIVYYTPVSGGFSTLPNGGGAIWLDVLPQRFGAREFLNGL